MGDMIWNAVQTYGPSILVIAAIIIVILGILKLCKVFDKIESKDLKKGIYLVIDLVLSFAGAAIYFAIFNVAFSGYYVLYSFALLSVVITLYAIYEQSGARWCVRKLLSLLANFFKKNPKNKFTQSCDQLGLVDAIIAWDAYLAKQDIAVLEEAKQEAAAKQAQQTETKTEDTASTETTTETTNVVNQ